ncbi:hypothetical protein TSUD_58380 [Trifolium subterraneum]|uniref:Uncharacterized protein n=1 Tax=Trifolium subterraneum TaxID=3900 RepID=A0A2Z6NPH5_TRISU|nr:hypothetical protein TSUD_58380 [Trifolium subterraneum]
MCPKFRSDKDAELSQHPFGFLAHSSGNSVALQLHISDGECYMTSGKMVVVLFEIKKLTEVVFTYKFDGEDSCFKMGCINEKEVVDVSSYDEDEDEDGFPLPGDDSKKQVLHFPPRTANGVIRDVESIMIRTQHRLDKSMCTIKEYIRIEGKKEMYMTNG